MTGVSWVCFDCRRVLRRPACSGDVTCAECGRPCRSIGDRIPVPPRDNLRGWAALRESLDEREEVARARGPRGGKT